MKKFAPCVTKIALSIWDSYQRFLPACMHSNQLIQLLQWVDNNSPKWNITREKLNPLTTDASHIENSQLTWSANQLNSFYMRETLVVKGLILTYFIITLRSVLKTLSNIYDGVLSRKYFRVKTRSPVHYFCKKFPS